MVGPSIKAPRSFPGVPYIFIKASPFRPSPIYLWPSTFLMITSRPLLPPFKKFLTFKLSSLYSKFSASINSFILLFPLRQQDVSCNQRADELFQNPLLIYFPLRCLYLSHF